MRHMSPETEARVHERVDAVSESVQMLVWEYQMRTADSEAFNIMDFTVSLVRGCRRQHPDSEQALELCANSWPSPCRSSPQPRKWLPEPQAMRRPRR